MVHSYEVACLCQLMRKPHDSRVKGNSKDEKSKQ